MAPPAPTACAAIVRACATWDSITAGDTALEPAADASTTADERTPGLAPRMVDSLADVERDKSTSGLDFDPSGSGLGRPAVAACATKASCALAAVRLAADDSIAADDARFGIGPAP